MALLPCPAQFTGGGFRSGFFNLVFEPHVHPNGKPAAYIYILYITYYIYIYFWQVVDAVVFSDRCIGQGMSKQNRNRES